MIQRRAFIIFSTATFLTFMAISSIAYFSVIFSEAGLSKQEIGWVLSAALVPTVVGVLICGELTSKFSALELAVAGQIIIGLAYASFLFTTHHVWMAATSRALVGFGYGLFFTAGLIYARSLITGNNAVFWFGIYTTMMPLPNLVGPGLAELLYHRAGITVVLAIFTGLAIVGIGMTRTLPAMPRQTVLEKHVGYRQILKSKETALAFFAIVVAGLMWGFSLSFVSLLLHESGVPTTTFFTATTLTMVLSRFTAMAWFGKKSKYLVIALGMLLMAIGYASLALFNTHSLLVILAGCFFGFGYSMSFPVLSLWATEPYPLAQRGRPMATITSFFQAGSFVVPMLVGLWSQWANLRSFLFALVAVALATATVMLVTHFKSVPATGA